MSLWRPNDCLNFIVIGSILKNLCGRIQNILGGLYIFGLENVADAIFLQKGRELRIELVQFVLD